MIKKLKDNPDGGALYEVSHGQKIACQTPEEAEAHDALVLDNHRAGLPLTYREPTEADIERERLRRIADEERQREAKAMAHAQALAARKVVEDTIEDLPDKDVEAVTYLFPAWSGEGVELSQSDKVRHEGVLYRVVQEHTTQADWPPDATPALFTRFRNPQGAPEPWKQPAGAHDAYQTGDRVTHKGKTWESDTADNVWEPGVFGWIEVSAGG